MTIPAGSGWVATFQRGRLPAWEPQGVSGRLTIDARALDEQQSAWLVLLARDVATTGTDALHCVFAFCNVPKASDELRQLGFQVLDSDIRYRSEKRRLEVRLDDGRPALALSDLPEPDATPYGKGQSGTSKTWRYRQSVLAPDLGQPDSELAVVDRDVVQRVELGDSADVNLHVDGDTAPQPGQVRRARWTALASAPARAAGQAANPRMQPGPVRREPRSRYVPLPPAFRFGDVEAIGFRLDLRALNATAEPLESLFDELVEPLNFHLSDGAQSAASDFRFRSASATLMLELLRYGRMESDPAGPEAAQCQHELLLRLLVGRVDDASAQARDPAFFVPSIFVDNAWSRLLGRELQGFDKRLATFCIDVDGKHPLSCSGQRPGDPEPTPLEEVTSVRLVQQVGGAPGDELLRLRDVPASVDSEFIDVDDATVLAGFDLGGMGWRQTDFDGAEFRRAFARETMATRLSGFRSVQVSPVDHRPPLAYSWIGSRFAFERLRVALPRGQPILKLGQPSNDSGLWSKVAGRIGGREIALPTGDWYRLRFDMTLQVDDSLGW